MQNTINKFQEYRSACDALFNSLGAVDPAKDACFFGVSRPLMAKQMMTLSDKLKTDDVSELLNTLRDIYRHVEAEVAGGMPANGRAELIEVLVGCQK